MFCVRKSFSSAAHPRSGSSPPVSWLYLHARVAQRYLYCLKGMLPQEGATYTAYCHRGRRHLEAICEHGRERSTCSIAPAAPCSFGAAAGHL